MSARRGAAALASATALYAGLAIHSLSGNSATFDEGAHLPAGYTHLVLGDHRLNPEQPPLVKLVAALPLRLVGPELRRDDPAWTASRQWEFGRRFLYWWNDADTLLFLGRLPIAAMGVVLIIAIFLWTERCFGPAAAQLAVALAALSPDLLAHGSLVTTDLAAALFFFLTVVAFAALRDSARPLRLLAAGGALGAALASKFSALVLFPLLLAQAAAEIGLAPRGEHVRAAKRLGLHLAAIVAVALVVVWASYGFRRAISPDAGVAAALRAPLETPPRPWAHALALAARQGVVPEDYARGLVFVMTHSRARPAFLLGEVSETGFPHFFLVTFLVKTPVPLLILTVLAAAGSRRLPRREAVYLWLPVAVYAVFALTRGLQIGHRHLLPIYPFLFVAAGGAAAGLLRRRPLGALIAALLLAWHAVGTLRVHPHYLAYFNELAGGPTHGYRVLVDSSLDWGQDLKRLRTWMDAHGVARIKLSYFGSADPRYYGIDAERLPGYSAPHVAAVTRELRPGDLVAISATNLQGVYLEPRDRALMARFRRLEPVGRVGWSILVFRADFSWPEP